MASTGENNQQFYNDTSPEKSSADVPQLERQPVAGRRLFWLCAALWLVAVLALSFQLAWQRVFILDFNPVNGDFQSYNVFRRMLAGQAPYQDFANYVGMAPVVLNLPFLLFRGDFAASLFVTNFTCNVLFSCVALAIFWLAGNRWPVAFLCSAVFTKLVSSGLVERLLGPAAGGYLASLFANLFTPSNSMRIARMFWPFLLVGAFVVFATLYRRRTGREFALADAAVKPMAALLAGGVAGMGVLWSNDFGLATALAGFVFLVVLLLGQKSAFPVLLRQAGCYVGALALAAVAAAFIVTGGHPLAYWQFMAGVSEFQYFYFNGTGGRALLPYIFTNVRLLAFTLPYGVWLVYCLWQVLKGRAANRQLLGAFVAFTVLAATYAYIVSGSGYNFKEALEGCLWLAVAAGVMRCVWWLAARITRHGAMAATAMVCAAAVACSGFTVRDVLTMENQQREGVLVPELGGYVMYPKALVDAAQLVGDEPVFSLYATGLEVVTGQFQPSGYDYVIHALGYPAQQHYLQTLAQGQYPYVQTTSLGLEGWLSAINWYVYREIAANYQREFETEYSWIWKRTANRQLDIQANLEVYQQDGMWVLEVKAPAGTDFVADVCISYSTSFSSAGGAVLSLGRRAAALTVPNPYHPDEPVGCYLPKASSEWYIPIAVQNGYGRALLFGSDPAHVTVSKPEAYIAAALPPLFA